MSIVDPAPAPLLARVRSTLRKADEVLRDALGPLASLAPDRRTATSFEALGARWLREGAAVEPRLVADGLLRLAEAQRAAFPANLFWDQDLLVSSVVRDATVAPEGAGAYLEDVFDRLVRVHHLFGQEMPIRFRYLHDFLYGFDWAKWVCRHPKARAAEGPFSRVFLCAIEERGEQLVAEILEQECGQSEASQAFFRNPFPFSRQPAAEHTLMVDLASRNLLPVRAWDPCARGDWLPPYQALRRERALALGLEKKTHETDPRAPG